MTSFAVVTPSRGLVHSRTIEAVMANVEQAVSAGHDFRGWRLSHALPIPECHEAVAVSGLATGADALVFIEEDMVPPAGAFLALLANPAAIVAIDYPVGEAPTQSCVGHWGPEGAPIWCGLGCTLVRREVFAGLERPWFLADTQLQLTRFGDRTVLTPVPHPYEYGGQDISFCSRATQAGFAIAVVPDVIAGHAHLRTWGQILTNQGFHAVDVRETIERPVA